MFLLESPRRGDSNELFKAYVFPKNNTGLSMKKYTIRFFCADRIDIVTNYAVIMNVIIKWVHCICWSQSHKEMST